MDVPFIERLMQLFEQSSLTELEYADGDTRIRVARPQSGAQAPSASIPQARPAAPAPTKPSPAGHQILASFQGVFYRKPKPEEPPFVAVGDVVAEGDTIGVLEAMKVLNRIEADRAGRITHILAEDGAMVEAGAPLFALAPEPRVAAAALSTRVQFQLAVARQSRKRADRAG